MLFATRSGKVKKTRLSDFRNYRKDGIIAIRIEEENELIDVKLTMGDDEICLVTNNGYCVRCKETDIRPMGRPSAGVRGIRPRENDYLVSLTVVEEGAQLLVASERGLGKRTNFEDYPTKGRGGKGVITMKVTEKTGPVIGALKVAEEDEIMLMTSAGQSVRIRAAEARLTGRNAQGVKLMNLREGESIQDIARVVSDKSEEDEVEAASDDLEENNGPADSEGGAEETGSDSETES